MTTLELKNVVVNKEALMNSMEKQLNSELKHMVHEQNKKVDQIMRSMMVSLSSSPASKYHYESIRDIKFYNTNSGYKIRIFVDDADLINELEERNKKILNRSIVYMVENYSTEGIKIRGTNTEVEFSNYPEVRGLE